MLFTLTDVLTSAEVAQAHAWLTDAPWEAGALTAGKQAASVKSNQPVSYTHLTLPTNREV